MVPLWPSSFCHPQYVRSINATSRRISSSFHISFLGARKTFQHHQPQFLLTSYWSGLTHIFYLKPIKGEECHSWRIPNEMESQIQIYSISRKWGEFLSHSQSMGPRSVCCNLVLNWGWKRSLVGVMISQGWYNKLPQTEWLSLFLGIEVQNQV